MTCYRHRYLVAVAAMLAACTSAPGADLTIAPASTPSIHASMTGTPLPQTVALPTPQLKGRLTLEETLALRRSVRDFSDVPLTLAELGQLLELTPAPHRQVLG